MGAQEFAVTGKGRSAEEAFRAVVDEAIHERGHDAYSGTVGTKRDFRIVGEPAQAVKRELLAKRVEGQRRVAAEHRERAAAYRKGGGYGTPAQHEEWAAGEEKTAAAADARADEWQGLLDGGKAIPFDLVSGNYVDKLLRDDRFDKWGPAGCIVIREPDKVKRLAKAQAESLAKEKYGPTATVEVKRQNHRSHATIYTVTKETRLGMNAPVAGGYRNSPRSAEGKDAAEAYGLLFSEPGEYAFFGLAPS
jgi:hypothetical protein